MLYIVATDRDTRVAALAQRHEVVLVVRATVCKRQDVMYFLGRRQSVLYRTLLTKGVRLDIMRTDFLPCATVAFVGVRITQVSVVLMLRNLLVFIAEPTVGQSATSGVGARALRFVWHLVPPGHEKTTGDFSSMAFYTAILLYLKITSTLIYSHLLEPGG